MEYLELLEHAVINQLESDFDDQDYDAMSEMIQFLLKSENSRHILIEYLSDEQREYWIQGKTKTRY